MSYSLSLREEEIKNRVSRDYFAQFDSTHIIDEIDFAISVNNKEKSIFNNRENVYFLWAEAKKGNKADIYESFVQLILTIGKRRTFDKYLPPAFLGAFDAEKIAFISYYRIMDVFSQNDFNWNVTPSNHNTKEFIQLYNAVKDTLESESYLFKFGYDDRELRYFIKTNFVLSDESISKIRIDKNNFVNVYYKWLESVKSSIAVDWDRAKEAGIIDADFYLADLLSEHNKTLVEKLFVILENSHYILDRKIDSSGFIEAKKAGFYDNQKSHSSFWRIYERPPKEEYWDYIIERRDLLVAQDIRERKGSFFTPRIWVEKSQDYIAGVLGEDWQDDYYVWDLAAGTGNLLLGLTNKYHIWASTVDRADVEIMKERVKNGANLLEGNIFQFDFLNDDFSKLPKSLQDVLIDEDKRRKLVVYINPPYAEATTGTTPSGTGKNKSKVAINNETYFKYKDIMGASSNELFAQFFIRIYNEIPDCILACFSTLKYTNSTNFVKFREVFKAKFLDGFIVPANTFDNVKGKFPIGFLIWDTSIKENINKTPLSIYNKDVSIIGVKTYTYNEKDKSINKWITQFNIVNDNKNKRYKVTETSEKEPIGLMVSTAPDFQHNQQLAILSKQQERYCFNIYEETFIYFCIYFSVRHCIEHTWINHNDQFLYPKDTWQDDLEFQSDCIAFTLFHDKNRISTDEGTNHFIPFHESQLNVNETFHSHFAYDFINGKIKNNSKQNLFEKNENTKIKFSKQAKEVFDEGLELYKYYHSFKEDIKYKTNASYYDIRLFFQGRNEKGRMNPTSKDETYNQILKKLKNKMDILAQKIAVKVYEHGFLRE